MTLLAKAKAAIEKSCSSSNTGGGEKSSISLSDQLNWDEAFKALGLAYFNSEKAMEVFEEVFFSQWECGMLPQLKGGDVDDNKTFSGIRHIRQYLTRPPLQGYLLWRIYELMEDKLRGKAFLSRLYPKIIAFHRYLYRERDPEEEGIVYVRHPWESGMDQSPVWDMLLQHIDISDLRAAQFDAESGLGPFAVQDPFFNALLAWSNESLIKIGAVLKKDISEVIQWHELTLYSLNEKLWEEERGIFNAFDLNSGKEIPITSIAGLLPVVGEVPTQDQAECILRTLESTMFGGKSNDTYLCPTNSMNTSTMAFQTKWRGGVNIMTNWMLMEGLQRYDMHDMAKRVKNDILNLCSKYGFYEYYDPRKVNFRPLGYGREEDLVAATICVDILMKETVAV